MANSAGSATLTLVMPLENERPQRDSVRPARSTEQVPVMTAQEVRLTGNLGRQGLSPHTANLMSVRPRSLIRPDRRPDAGTRKRQYQPCHSPKLHADVLNLRCHDVPDDPRLPHEPEDKLSRPLHLCHLATDLNNEIAQELHCE